MGKLVKNLMKFTVAAAAVGGVCYAFKDKIKESKVYKDCEVDEKLNKVKTTIKEKMPKIFDNEEDYVEDDEIFFEDDDFDPDNTSRDYVSLNTENASSEDSSAGEATDDDADTAKDAKASDDDVPTIEV